MPHCRIVVPLYLEEALPLRTFFCFLLQQGELISRKGHLLLKSEKECHILMFDEMLLRDILFAKDDKQVTSYKERVILLQIDK